MTNEMHDKEEYPAHEELKLYSSNSLWAAATNYDFPDLLIEYEHLLTRLARYEEALRGIVIYTEELDKPESRLIAIHNTAKQILENNGAQQVLNEKQTKGEK